jgi:hypothetical protein
MDQGIFFQAGQSDCRRGRVGMEEQPFLMRIFDEREMRKEGK